MPNDFVGVSLRGQSPTDFRIITSGIQESEKPQPPNLSFSPRLLCVLCVSAVKRVEDTHRRVAEEAQGAAL